MTTAAATLVGILVGCILMAVASALGRWTGKRLKALCQPEASAEPERQPAPPPRNPSSPWQWHAMPCGKRMELGATGFYIVLAPDKDGAAYQGFTPEHFRQTRGNDLAAMKRFLEGEARERAEFEPQPVTWRRS